MIELALVREPTEHGGTFGILYIDQPGQLLPDVHARTPLCLTLEDQIRPPGVKVHGETCIPPGRYRVTLVTSARFGPDTPSIEDVPNFQYIRIHAGNVIDDTDGCILVGETRSRRGAQRPWLGNSRAALKRVVAGIKGFLLLQDALYITIENPVEVTRGINADEAAGR